tara:strand:+ start:814 stop:1452 length:639 start_codon:yes stop_codon:yes gene_type:complete
MEAIASNIAKKKQFYSNKLKTFGNWSTKKSSINGTSDKYIRNMLSQMLKELSLPQSNVSNIINTIYSRDFDTTKLVNCVYKYKNNIFDLLSNDSNVRIHSANAAIYSLETIGVKTNGLHTGQLSGLCIFVQFILCGGRNELEGFGASENLVEKWKKQHKLLKQKQIQERQKQIQEECRKTTNIVNHEEEEEDEHEKSTLPQELNIPDSWEDL